MIELPVCGHRGNLIDGKFFCDSPKLRPNPCRVTGEFCAETCPYHDNGPKHESRAPVPTRIAVEVKPRDKSCQHLGRAVRDGQGIVLIQECPTCCGEKKTWPLMQCLAGHGQVSHFVQCQQCPDYAERLPVVASVADDYFGAVRVISLPSTPDRLERFNRDFSIMVGDTWPWKTPEVFAAIQGDTSNVPSKWNWYDANHGAVGCWNSWTTILKQAVDAGLDKPLLVFEDDAGLVDGAVEKIRAALATLPDDWEILFLGGQHDSPPQPFKPGLVRCTETGRTHALAIHPRYFAELYRFWTEECQWHVDRCLKKIARQRQFYAMDPFVSFQAAGWSLLRNRHEPARAWDDRVQIGSGIKQTVFSHSGDLGDIIYALPAIRAACRPERATLNITGADFTRRKMTPEIVAEFAPLLESQPYIARVQFAEAKQGFDLDAWRQLNRPNLYNLADRQLDLLDYAHAERETPWIAVEPKRVAPAVFARSQRYHTDAMPWKQIVERYKNSVFVGLPEEHRDFVSRFDHVPFYETTNYFELARVIAGAEMFAGNQSSPMALRIAMGLPFILERVDHPDNCHFERTSAFYNALPPG